MLSGKKQILQLVALLHAHGVEDVVVCPGSRNAPIVHTMNECGLFRCHPLTDERSAGFYALGLSLATHRPTVVCVTSGSALLNLHPAVAEAYYQQVPLVVVSADRPAAWIGQMDGQTMPQPEALGKMVRCCVNLPEANTEEEEWYANRLINEAMLTCLLHGQGPVHINVPISEPLYAFDCPYLPQVRVIRHTHPVQTSDWKNLADTLRNTTKCMILIGQMHMQNSLSADTLSSLATHCVIVRENLANVGNFPLVKTDPDELLSCITHGEEADFMPDLLITLGGHIVSKRIKQFLRSHKPLAHWHVSEEGKVADLFGALTLVVESPADCFLEHLSQYMTEPSKEANPFLARWKELHPRFTSLYWENIFEALPHGSVLHLANSSVVRRAQHFPLHESITVCCNRGINGIEGSMSAAVGYAQATPERLNFFLTGDLSFFYDQNALWNIRLPRNLHILLINSGGGAIFDTLPLPENESSRHLISATQHFSASHLCQHYGIQYRQVENKEEWEKALPDFITRGNGCMLIEITI